MPALKIVGNRNQFPRVEDVSPAYVKLLEKANLISNQIATLRDKLRLAADAATERTGGGHGEDEAANARIASILGRPPQPKAGLKSDHEADVRLLSREIKDREAALLVLDREIDVERRAASAIIMKQLDPAYRAIVAKIGKIFIQLHEANREYAEFADHLNMNNISWSGVGAMPLWFIGSPTDPDSNIARYLREAVDGGFLRSSDMPSEFVA